MATLLSVCIIAMQAFCLKSLYLYYCNIPCVFTAGDFTLFAPIDTAFGVYRDNLLRPGNPNNSYIYSGNALSAESDSDVMLCLQIYKGLIIDRSLVY